MPSSPGTEELPSDDRHRLQVHAYEANIPKRLWHSVLNWPDYVTGEEMVAVMA